MKIFMFTTDCRCGANWSDRPKRISPSPENYWLRFLVIGLVSCLTGMAVAQSPTPTPSATLSETAIATPSPSPNNYPAASHVPDSQPGWQEFLTKVDPSRAKDEPEGGRTAQGTPVEKRIEECFPAEPRNLFWQVDQIASGPGGKLQPINYDLDGDGKISDEERNAIRGQNTWILWGEGNETFWGWLQERGYGLVDFLIFCWIHVSEGIGFETLDS